MSRKHRLGSLLAAFLVSVASAQEPQPQLDTEDLGRAPYGRMHMLLEKSFLDIDVLEVDIRFGADTADALRALVAGQKRSSELADRIAARAQLAEDAYVAIVFKRGVSLDDFVSAITKNLGRARHASMIDEDTYQNVAHNLPRWFAFLREGGIKSGDRILYRARPTSMRTVYMDKAGRVRLDQTDQGPAGRLALLGGYFAPGSDFRDGLVASIFAK